jgi:hypothetical protein
MAMAKKTPSAGRRNYDVTPEQFVKTWQGSETTQEVADKLGMPLPIVFARASAYRKAGVHLKKHKRKGKQGLDVEGLNRLIAQLGAGRGPEELLAEARAQEEAEGIFSPPHSPQEIREGRRHLAGMEEE